MDIVVTREQEHMLDVENVSSVTTIVSSLQSVEREEINIVMTVLRGCAQSLHSADVHLPKPWNGKNADAALEACQGTEKAGQETFGKYWRGPLALLRGALEAVPPSDIPRILRIITSVNQIRVRKFTYF